MYGPAWILLAFSAVKVAGSHLAVAFATLAGRHGHGRGHHVRHRGPGQTGRTLSGAGWGLLAYAWNPLVLMVVPLAGSADVAVACGFALAFLAIGEGRPWLATVLLTLAALVKVYALIGIVLYLVLLARQRGARRGRRPRRPGHRTGRGGLRPVLDGLSTFKGCSTRPGS